MINKIKNFLKEYFYPYVTEVTVTEEGADPYNCTMRSRTHLDAVQINNALMDIVELNGLDKTSAWVEYTVTKNGEYVDGDEGYVTFFAERTTEPSKLVKWDGKEPHIFAINKASFEAVFEI